jgi:hypothetical protein
MRASNHASMDISPNAKRAKQRRDDFYIAGYKIMRYYLLLSDYFYTFAVKTKNHNHERTTEGYFSILPSC